jgi:hypothetical protein
MPLRDAGSMILGVFKTKTNNYRFWRSAGFRKALRPSLDWRNKMSNNIMGIDLNVDHNFLEAAVRDTVLTAIASAMDKEEVVQAIVHEALSMKVDEDGKVNSYSNYNRYTVLEYYVKTAIRDEAVKMAKEIIDEKTPLIRENVRREFERQETVDSLVDAFMNSVTSTLKSSWRCKVDVSFDRDRDDDEIRF